MLSWLAVFLRYSIIVVGVVALSFSLIALARTTVPFAPSQAEPSAASTEAEKTNEPGTNEQKLLAAYEREQAKLRAEVIKRRRLYQDGQISKAEVAEAEQAFVSALARVHELRRSIMENEMAIAEAAAHDALARMPVSSSNGFAETDSLSRFNGAGRWSLKDAQGIDRFFFQTFRQHLPVTAYGQTATHSRMRFDHRDSIDVALHPDSPQGKALIKHLRESGVPFIAFRGRVAGASTGAHIHIGQPSHRIRVVFSRGTE